MVLGRAQLIFRFLLIKVWKDWSLRFHYAYNIAENDKISKIIFKSTVVEFTNYIYNKVTIVNTI